MNSAIVVSGLRKRFGKVIALDSIQLDIAAGEFFSLLGPSGCGKTTLLRLIAGFEEPEGGEIRIGGEPMRGVPPQRRPVNTVFQNYALFPHLTVFENVAFGLRVKGTPSGELEKRVMEGLELLHVAELKNRRPAEISGGQKQRVALARALVVRPKALLLDEPLAAVDAQRRAQVQKDLRALQRETGTTFLYVTHDQDEALALSDRLAVMNAGKIAQIGSPQEIYERPQSRLVASFIGSCNIFSGTAADDAAQALTALGKFRLSEKPGKKEITLGIRAERIVFGSTASENLISALVTNVS